MVASPLIKSCLPLFHQCIQRASDFREIPICNPSIDLSGLWTYTPKQHLDISQVRFRFYSRNHRSPQRFRNSITVSMVTSPVGSSPASA